MYCYLKFLNGVNYIELYISIYFTVGLYIQLILSSTSRRRRLIERASDRNSEAILDTLCFRHIVYRLNGDNGRKGRFRAICGVLWFRAKHAVLGLDLCEYYEFEI